MKNLIAMGAIAVIAFFGLNALFGQSPMLGGFTTGRGTTTLQTNNSCSTYVIPKSASTSLNWDNSCVQQLTRSQNVTISSFTGGVGQGRMWLILTASISTPGTVTWPSSVKWASVSQTAPTLSGAGKVDLFEFFSVTSGSYYGVYTGRKNAPQ